MSDANVWPSVEKAAKAMVQTIAECPLSQQDKARIMSMLSAFFIEQTVMSIEASRGHRWDPSNPIPTNFKDQGRDELLSEIRRWAEKGEMNFRFIRRPTVRERN